MSVSDFLFGKKLRISVGELGLEYIDLDCTDSETYNHDSNITDHPIEGGQNIVDHVRVMPIGLTIEGFITNHATSRTFVNLDFTRAEDCYTLLRDWQNTAQRLTISTGLDDFEDMILKSFTVTRDKETGNALPVRLDFKEIQVVEGQLSSAKAPAIKAAVAKKKAAKKAKKEEKRASRLKQGAKLLNDFFGVK